MARTKKAEKAIEDTVVDKAEPSTAELMEIIAQLQSKIEKLEQPEPAAPVAVAKPEKSKARKITFTNLSGDNLFLNGNTEHTVAPFQSFRVSEKEALKIIENWEYGLREGVYTCDQDFIDENDFEIADGVLTDPEKILSIFKMEPDDAKKFFMALPPEQRGSVVEHINTMIMQGKVKNTDTVYEIGGLVGKDFKEISYRVGK